jgi:hypothetical protein
MSSVAAGHTDAMIMLGLLLDDNNRECGRSWYQQAATVG